VLVAQLLLVGVVTVVCWRAGTGPAPTEAGDQHGEFPYKLLFEALLTCIIGPSAAAAPVVVGKLGGNISTMTTYTLLSAFVSALLIPLVFPLLEQTVHTDFLSAFLIILYKVTLVLLLPLVLGWLTQHYAPTVAKRIAAMPNLSFYTWAVCLSITTGITVKNIVHSEATLTLLAAIAVGTLFLCVVQFVIGRAIGRRLGEEVNAGQALFQKNTGLSIWVSYMYLSPVSSVGPGCYVLWQNIINSVEIWAYTTHNKQ
jgi:BASS family bile acid:Na+ symporter